MKKSNKIIGLACFAVAACIWAVLFCTFSENTFTLYPKGGFGIYPLNDSLAGGYSTVSLTEGDNSIVAEINVRSGKSYPYAGIGFNLMSREHRPTGHFDLSKFDTISIIAVSGRMRSITLRLLTDDPVYSRQGSYLTYRPLEIQVPVEKSFSEHKVPLSGFKTCEWWLAERGMEQDDGLTYFYRAALFEIFNGEGTLRGIPDEIEVKSAYMWGENRDFKKGMYLALAFLVILFAGFAILAFRKPVNKEQLKRRMERTASLLKTTDKSLAEIAIAVGEKSPARLESNFRKVYGVKPMDYRRKNA